MSNTMKQVLVYVENEPPYHTTTEITNAPIPEPGPGKVLIRVIVAGTNPKDWKAPVFFGGKSGTNTGDDVAGYIEAIGKGVTEFKKGDRVAAFHEMGTPDGAFAEYAISWASTTFHLPEETTFEEAATIPLAAMTAATGLFCRLGLPEPWVRHGAGRAAVQNSAVLVYGGASAVGAFAIKLLARANIHPVITVAGRGTQFVEGLLDRTKGDAVIDYRQGDLTLIEQIRHAVPVGKTLSYAFDAISESKSQENILQVLDANGYLTNVLPYSAPIPETVHFSPNNVGDVHGLTAPSQDFGHAWFRLFSMGLQEGWFSGHPYEVIPGGLGGVETGLRRLKDGAASAVKYVYRVEETE